MKISIKVIEATNINDSNKLILGAYKRNDEKYSDFVKRTINEYKRIFDIDITFYKILYSTNLDVYDLIDFENKASYSNITSMAFGFYISYLQEKITKAKNILNSINY